MTDHGSMEALLKLSAVGEITDVSAFSLDLLRSCHSAMTKFLPLITEALRKSDEADLATARARVAEIEARLGVQTKPPSLAAKLRTEMDETDAGNGVGEQAEEATAQGLRDELASLRQHTQEKRRRRALA